MKWLPLLLVACSSPAPAPPLREPPAPPAAPVADAAVAAQAPVDACERMRTEGPTWPVPPPSGDARGSFVAGPRREAIRTLCDLKDRVLMVPELATPTQLIIWRRGDGSVRTYPVTEMTGHTGREAVVTKTAPAADRLIDFTPDRVTIMCNLGNGAAQGRDHAPTAPSTVSRLLACSTKAHFAVISAADAGCTAYPDGIGAPLELTLHDAGDHPTTATGALTSISSDRATWTYRFDRTELIYNATTRAGELHLADGTREPCVATLADHR